MQGRWEFGQSTLPKSLMQLCFTEQNPSDVENKEQCEFLIKMLLNR